MTANKAHPTDIHSLAAEVMDLWQEHLSLYASDPDAKAELIKLLEPQRQLFADWTAMMQNNVHGTGAAKTDSSARTQAASPTVASAGAASAAPAFDDGALRVAQLAHRLAELEKRVSQLESQIVAGAAKTSRRRKTH